MRRHKPSLVTRFALAALPIWMAAAVLGARSKHTEDVIEYNKKMVNGDNSAPIAVLSLNGYVMVDIARYKFLPSRDGQPGGFRPGHHWRHYTIEANTEQAGIYPRVPWFRYSSGHLAVGPFPQRFGFTIDHYDFDLPYWCVMFVALIPLGIAVIRSLTGRRRATVLASGSCPHCGYDIRATPDRCPECGMQIVVHRCDDDDPNH